MKTLKRLNISRFDNLNNSSKDVEVEKFYNYLPTNSLKNSKGVNIAKFPYSVEDPTEYSFDFTALGIDSVDGVTYFKQFFSRSQIMSHRLLLYGSDGKIYINEMLDDDHNLVWVYNLMFNKAPIALPFKQNDTDSIILTDETKMVVWKTGYAPYEIEGTVPVITSMCMNDGVLFCTIQDPAFKVWYATDLDAENIGNINNHSGYIALPDELGNALKVVTFNEDVYVFREYGITKISYIKGQTNISHIYQSNTKILSNTVAVCGNVIWFMTKNGLYTFNGNKVSVAKVELENLLAFQNENAVASSLGDKYYLACKLNFGEDNEPMLNSTYVNNALVIVDTDDSSFQIIRGVDIRCLLPIKNDVFERMLCTFYSVYHLQLGQIVDDAVCFTNPLPKFWKSKNLFENLNVKNITKLVVDADKDVKFTLIYDGGQYEFTTNQSGINEFSFKISCKNLQLQISSNKASAEVRKVYLDYYEY